MATLLTQLSQSVRTVPSAAVPAMLDCILTSTDVSPLSLFDSLLLDFSNLTKEIFDDSKKMDSEQCAYLVSYLRGLSHLMKKMASAAATQSGTCNKLNGVRETPLTSIINDPHLIFPSKSNGLRSGSMEDSPIFLGTNPDNILTVSMDQTLPDQYSIFAMGYDSGHMASTSQAATDDTRNIHEQSLVDEIYLDLSLDAQNISLSSSKKRKDMGENELRDCIKGLLHKAINIKLPHGTIKNTAQHFGVSRWTIQRVWKKVKHCLQLKQSIKVQKNYKGKCGKKPIKLDLEALMAIPLEQRCSIRSLAAALKISKSTVHRFIKCGKIERHSNTLEPALTSSGAILQIQEERENLRSEMGEDSEENMKLLEWKGAL